MAVTQGQPWVVAPEGPVPVNQQLPPWGQTAANVPGLQTPHPAHGRHIGHPNPHHVQKLHALPGRVQGDRNHDLADLFSSTGGLHLGVRR
jgi:hypothetical protein